MAITDVPRWEQFELTLPSGASYENPFLDVDVEAVFRCGSTEHRVDGFYDGVVEGRHTWRVRFAPPTEGEWRYATSSDDDDLVVTGSLWAGPPVSSGSLALDPLFGNWVRRQDGSPIFLRNEGWYPHVANRSGNYGAELGFEDVDFRQPSEAEWMRYLEILAEHRINLIVDIGQLYARQSTITDPSFRWPWKVVDAAANRIDRDRFNLDYYQRMDRQLARARELGIFFAMELLYDNSVVRTREWAHHPSNVDNGGWLRGNDAGVGWNAWFDLDDPVHVEYVRRYVRYTWARFGAAWNVVWSVGSENGNLARINDERLPQAFIDPAIPAAWYSYWVDWLNRRDPYERLKSYGDAGRQELMVTTTYNSFIVTQDPRNYPKDDPRDAYRAMNAFGEMMWRFGRPVVIGEMTAGNNGRYDEERRLYWVALVSGYSMGRCDRHYAVVTDDVLTESVKFGLDDVPPIYRDIRTQADFMESRGVRHWRMRPSDRLLAHDPDLVYCLAAEDEEYLVYFVEGGSATLTLPACRGEWFDPRSGATHARFDLPAGDHGFAAPDDEDWVLHVRAV